MQEFRLRCRSTSGVPFCDFLARAYNRQKRNSLGASSKRQDSTGGQETSATGECLRMVCCVLPWWD
jgi:hypothetical protein